MSKRSKRRKRREKQQKEEARLTGPVLAQQGLQAFRQADYAQAIKCWEQATRKKDAPEAIPSALAEAYFRLAMNHTDPIKNMAQAVKFQPNDALYRYHLALAHHRAGNLEQAEPLYRDLLKQSPPFERAAAPLAQLLIEQKKAVPKDPVWARLSPAQQRQLAAAEALIKNKAASTLQRLAETPLEPIWQGMVALALDDIAASVTDLKPLTTPDSDAPPQICNVARYYLGLTAAQAGQDESALAHWQAAKNNDLDTPHLHRNVSVTAYTLALKAQQAGQPEQAQQLLNQVSRTAGIQQDLRAFTRQLSWEMGYAAAQKGNWQQALVNWQQAEQAGDNSRSLLFNLALAYQHQEQFGQAAEHWRTVLRRRPRKADHPEALTDQQVARIWQNIAENYSKAGHFDEAVTTYKNALKWAPNNLDIRLKLVESLQNEGRWQAAENELDRILDKDPDNVPALVLRAESYSDGYFQERPRQLWRRILKLEPQHPVARQQLAHTFEVEAMRWTEWGYNYQEAIKILKAGLKEVPDSQRLLTVTGGTYADWDKFDQARDYLAQAVARNPNDMQTLYTIFTIWLENGSKPDMMQTLQKLQAISPAPPAGLFLDLSERCLQYSQSGLTEQILNFVVHSYSADVDARVGAAGIYIELDQERKALPILRQVLKEQPDHIPANIELGFVYYYTDQTRLAKRQWDKASELARQTNNQAMVHRVKLIKDEYLHGKRPPQNMFEALKTMPPELLDELLKTAPPEIAAMLRNMSPAEMMAMLAGFGGFDDDDDLFR